MIRKINPTILDMLIKEASEEAKSGMTTSVYCTVSSTSISYSKCISSGEKEEPSLEVDKVFTTSPEVKEEKQSDRGEVSSSSNEVLNDRLNKVKKVLTEALVEALKITSETSAQIERD